MEHLRDDRRTAGRAQDDRRRARGSWRRLGQAAVRDVPGRVEAPYGERRSAFGKERYSALGIAREDWEARQRAAIANWNCFGAPAALFCYIDRELGLPQWADVGMYLQTVMLLLRAEGLHSCPQMAWSQVRETVAEVLSPRTGSSSSAACRSGTKTPRSVTPVQAAPRSTRRSRSSAISDLRSKDRKTLLAYDTSFIMRDIGEPHDHA